VRLRILILEDNPADAELIVYELRRAGIEADPVVAVTRKDFEARLDPCPDAILSDYHLPHWNGLDALRTVRERGLEVPFIIVSGNIGEDLAVEAMRNGADDYLLKDRLSRLGAALTQAIERKRAAAERLALLDRNGAIVRALGEIVYDWRPPTDELLWEGDYTRVLGYDAAEMGQDTHSWTSRVHPEDLEKVLAEVAASTRERRLYDLEYRFRHRGGGYVWMHDRGVPFVNPDGQLIRVIGVFSGIAERKAAEEKIRRLSRVHAVLSGINALIVRVRDRDELFKEACRIAVQAGRFRMAWLGVGDRKAMRVKPVAWHGTGEDYINSMPLRLDDPGSSGHGFAGRVIVERKAMIASDMTQDPRVLLRNEALERGFHSLAMLPLLAGGEAVGILALYAGEVGFFDDAEMKLLNDLAGDISFALQHLAQEEKVNYLAYYDTLTGLPNRVLFLERVSQALRAAGSAGSLVLVLGDIKRFRMINDTLGRHAGDEFLKQVAGRLVQLLQYPENLARIAADCFATFLPDVRDLSELAHRIEQLTVEGLRNPIAVAGQELSLGFVVGAAVYPQDGADAETLFRNAEAALKKAKAGGEPYLFYAPEMNARVAESLALENKLRKALESGQFVLFYQPKVEVRTRTMTGLEALIRWKDPELGLVPPAKFIPLMEETGLILEVGRWALGRAVSDYRRWASEGLMPPRIAVNVSPIQLRRKEFIDSVVHALEGFEGDEIALDLEVTESMIMENVQETIEKLKVVKGLGVEIAVDDFGTGYSSLSYVAKLPINALKIDRSFIIEMAKSEYSRNIVTMVIQLAHTLNLKVIAEGVDEEEQVRILRELGCDEMQGYLMSKPLPPEEIGAMLKERLKSNRGSPVSPAGRKRTSS